jgi:hypothetical protein
VSLMYTPLYTRPGILEMVREWAKHVLARLGLGGRAFLNSLDEIVRSQLRLLLEGSAPPALLTSDGKAPYASLPLLGHYAVYSLNLLLVRAVVGDGTFKFNEEEMPGHEGGARPWEQLSHLWRSWLSTESLSGLAAVVRSTRTHGGVEIHAEDHFGSPTGDRLETIWATANALADSATAVLSGLPLYDASVVGPVTLDAVRALADNEELDLTIQVCLRTMRREGWRFVGHSDQRLVAAHVGDAVALRRCTRTHGELLSLLVDDDAPIELRESGRSRLKRPDRDALIALPEPFMIAHTRFCASIEPWWITDLVDMNWHQISVFIRERPRLTAVILTAIGAVVPTESERTLEVSVGLARHLTEGSMMPDLLIATLLHAHRIGSEGLERASVRRLLGYAPDEVLRASGPEALRQLMLLTEMRGRGDELARWLCKAQTIPGSTPGDVALDLIRLGVDGEVGRESITRLAPLAWGVTSQREVAAWLRLLRARPEYARQVQRWADPWVVSRRVASGGEGWSLWSGLRDVSISSVPDMIEVAKGYPGTDLQRSITAIIDKYVVPESW